MFSVLVIRLRSLRLLRVSGIVMRLRMFLLLITFLKASHSFRNRLLVICKNAYLFATMIMTSVSSPFSRSEERFSRNAETDLVCRLLLEKKNPAKAEQRGQPDGCAERDPVTHGRRKAANACLRHAPHASTECGQEA